MSEQLERLIKAVEAQNAALATIDEKLQIVVNVMTSSGLTETIEVEELVGEVLDGTPYWKIKGGNYKKHGIRIWDEVLEDAGIDPARLIPGKKYPLDGTAVVLMAEPGKPKKVKSLVRKGQGQAEPKAPAVAPSNIESSLRPSPAPAAPMPAHQAAPKPPETTRNFGGTLPPKAIEIPADIPQNPRGLLALVHKIVPNYTTVEDIFNILGAWPKFGDAAGWRQAYIKLITPVDELTEYFGR